MVDYSEAENVTELLGLMVGTASMCWSDVDGAGVFDDRQAADVVDAGVRRLIELGWAAPPVTFPDVLAPDIDAASARLLADNAAQKAQVIANMGLGDSRRHCDRCGQTVAGWFGLQPGNHVVVLEGPVRLTSEPGDGVTFKVAVDQDVRFVSCTDLALLL